METKQFNNRYKVGDAIKLIGEDSLITIMSIDNDTVTGLNSDGLEKLISIENSEFELTLQVIQELQYDKMKSDYARLSTQMMSEFKLAKDAGIFTSEQLFEIEFAFKEVDRVGHMGRWKTALFECEKVIVGGSVSQQLYDRIHLAISNYIADNY